jgi:uroporphyrinogen-III synthase
MATKSLAKLRVLITRPEGRGDELQAALQAAGAYCLQQPLLEIAPLSESDAALRQCRSYLADLDNYQRLIFISVNAVEHGLTEIDRLWPQWPQGVAVYAIGEATARALRDAALPVAAGMPTAELSTGTAMNSEALLRHPDFLSPRNEKILIFRGLGGREHLADVLRQRGAQVDYAECYRRMETPLNSGELAARLQVEGINSVCLNSGETLQHFSAQLDEATSLKQQIWLIVPSERVAVLASTLGFTKVWQAENAGSAATLAALAGIAERC